MFYIHRLNITCRIITRIDGHIRNRCFIIAYNLDHGR
jgi:hypothetical protein